VRKAAVRVAAPVLFLAAVTAVVLIARSALHRTPATAAAAPPARTASAPSIKQASGRAYYRLTPGDTLDGVARRFKTSVHQLLLFNPGVHAATLVPGQKLRVR
jgi:LysM repeat protein